MKNLLSKTILLTIVSIIFIGGAIFVKAQNTDEAVATDTAPLSIQNIDNSNFQRGMNWGMMERNLNTNIENQNFNNFIPRFAMAFIGLGFIFVIIAILLLAFWIWMLIHAIRHDIDYKPVWILVLWFLNIFGAIIYYFAVKRQCPCCENWEEMCMCEDGKCACVCEEEMVKEDIKE